MMCYHKHFRQFVITIVLTVIAFTSCYTLGIPDPHSLKYDEKPFNKLANDILQQHSIYTMDDLDRYTKVINGVGIRLSKEEDTSDLVSSYTKYIDSALDSLHIDRKLVDKLRKQLEGTELREFHRSGDSILFIVDGFLDNSWGYFYTNRKNNDDTLAFEFSGFGVYPVEKVNDHWKKVGID